MTVVATKRLNLPTLSQYDEIMLQVEFVNDDDELSDWEFDQGEYEIYNSEGNVIVSDSTAEVNVNKINVYVDSTTTAILGEYELVVRAVRTIDPDSGLTCDPVVFNRSGRFTVTQIRFDIPIYYRNDNHPLLIPYLNQDGTDFGIDEVYYSVKDSTGNVIISLTEGEVATSYVPDTPLKSIACFPIDETVTAIPGEYEVFVKAIRSSDNTVICRSGILKVLDL